MDVVSAHLFADTSVSVCDVATAAGSSGGDETTASWVESTAEDDSSGEASLTATSWAGEDSTGASTDFDPRGVAVTATTSRSA